MLGSRSEHLVELFSAENTTTSLCCLARSLAYLFLAGDVLFCPQTSGISVPWFTVRIFKYLLPSLFSRCRPCAAPPLSSLRSGAAPHPRCLTCNSSHSRSVLGPHLCRGTRTTHAVFNMCCAPCNRFTSRGWSSCGSILTQKDILQYQPGVNDNTSLNICRLWLWVDGVHVDAEFLGVNDNTSLNICRLWLWVDGVHVDAEFLDYNTLGTNLKVWGNLLAVLTVDGAVVQITDTPSRPG
jgi:hypothetical protein